MKNAEARRHIFYESSLKLYVIYVVPQQIPQTLQHFSTAPLPDAVSELAIALLACGFLLPVAFAVMDGWLSARRSREEKKQNARQARREVGLWRTFWIWLSVTIPLCLIQSLMWFSLAIWRHYPHPSSLIYAALGIGVGFYVALLIVIYHHWIGDFLAEPQTIRPVEK